MPRGRPHALWLRQVESYLKDTGMAGQASAEWSNEGRRSTVARGTRRRACPAYAPIPDVPCCTVPLIDSTNL